MSIAEIGLFYKHTNKVKASGELPNVLEPPASAPDLHTCASLPEGLGLLKKALEMYKTERMELPKGMIKSNVSP